MGFIRNWKDKCFLKRLERVLSNNELNCNIRVNGIITALVKPVQGGGGSGNVNGDKPNAPKHDNLIEPEK